MKLNYHYEISVNENHSHLVAAQRLFDQLIVDYPEIEFTKIDYRKTDYSEPIIKYSKFKHNHVSHFFVIIENPENNKYFLITCCDKIHCIKGEWDMENCIEIFPSCGVHSEDLNYTPNGMEYTPISCLSIRKTLEDKAQELYKLNTPKITPDKPHFRGCGYLFREWLVETKDPRFIMECDRIPDSEYILELSKYSISIDINTVAEISGRTVDSLALGLALIRPKLTINFHNELIPDFHYAAVRCNNLSNYPLLADAYIERFEELKKDKDLVHFLSVNGRKWYEENATIDSYVGIVKNLIDFRKLF